MNLTACGVTFNNIPNQSQYGDNRTDTGLPGEQPVITFQGCRELCGSGADTYSWMDIANSITTWVFPIIGILLQAPFESNNTIGTFFALLRWLGSPIGSLSYIFWNIKVSGRAALLVDMATKYNEIPHEGSDFSDIRDSFYILTVMNQYTINPKMRKAAEAAENLLRTALFDESLKVDGLELMKLRENTASNLRKSRKRGVVAVFISMGWFLFSLAISIQAVFSNIGSIEQPDNLGLGLMLAWIPVLILSSIVDRNPANSVSVEKSLNQLLSGVQRSLLTADHQEQVRRGSVNEPVNSFKVRDRRRSSMVATGQQEQVSPDWIKELSKGYFKEDFFTGFGGQGRRRWHYGVAYTIVAGIEDEFVKEYGRDWLQHPEARDKLVKPYKPYGIFFFDLRELWQIASSAVVVTGTIFGAFILNYFTPPVGVDCRSGGYAIFCCWVTLIFILEMAAWWWTSKHTDDEFKVQRFLEHWFFIPAETISICWFLYIVIAQATGIYNNCWCLTWGGWFNFQTTNYWNVPGVKGHWITALCLSLTVMVLSFAFIIAEWCTQSHMATDNYKKAMKGLARTRTFKWLTSPIRNAVDFLIIKVKLLMGRKRKSLVWKKHHRQEPDVRARSESVSKEVVEEVESKPVLKEAVEEVDSESVLKRAVEEVEVEVKVASSITSSVAPK